MTYPGICSYEDFPYTYCENVLRRPFSITDQAHKQCISEILAYIHQNFSKDISLDEISKRVYSSKYHFSRVFKKYTSSTPYQYLIAVRLEHARLLLSTSGYPVKAIAERCGFKRLDYFSAMFKRKFKSSPSQYRETWSACNSK